MPKAIVFRVNYDLASEYMNGWLDSVVNYAKLQGYEVIDLSGPNATLEKFLAALEENPDVAVIVIGTHGAPERIVGDLESPFLTSCVNDDVLAGRVAVIGACLAGQVLSKTAREKGASMVVGYNYEYVWPIDPNAPSPAKDEVARAFGELYVFPIKLVLDGLPAKEIYSMTTGEYDKVYKELSQSPYISAAFATTALENNRDGLIIYGESVLTAPPPSVWPIYLLLGGAGIAAGVAVYNRWRKK